MKKIYLILGGIIVALLVTCYFLFTRVNTLNEKYSDEVKLRNALLDTTTMYKNKHNEWTAEKLTMQATLKQLQDNNLNLNTNQKELIKRIGEIEKTNSIIAAALIETNVKIDSLRQGEVTINNDSSLTFNDSTKNLKYNINVGFVIPAYRNIKPTLTFKSFELPNKQIIDFHWKDDAKKDDYPIAFSVSNSNDYFKTVNIESYAIPGLDKKELNPTFWQKFGKWTVKNGKIITTVGVSGAVGLGVGMFLLK
jgi:hypothetical protein